MKKTLHINVFKQLGETLNSREAATSLFAIVRENNAKNVVFGFSEVIFMSRSFADQFHKERLKIKAQNGLVIHLSDTSETIRKMLVTVEATQNKQNRFYSELPIFSFSEKNLENYLQAI
jgi:hypothetical protein